MRAAIILVALLPLAGCLQPPAVAPLGTAEAQALRAGSGNAAAVVMLVPAPDADPPLPLAGEVAVDVDGQPQPLLRTQDATVILATGRPLRIAAGRPPAFETVVEPGRTAFLGIVPGAPRVDDTVPAMAVTRLDDAAGRALLAARVPMRRAEAPAPEPPSSALRAEPDAAARAAVDQGRIAPGLGRLLVAAGTVVNERGGVVALLPSLDTIQGDVVVEGVALGALRPGELLAVDLPPGTYAMHWVMRNRLYDTRWLANHAAPLPFAATIRAGQATALRADMIDRSSVRVSFPGPVGRPQGLRYPVLRPASAPPGGTLVVPAAAALAALPGAAVPGR